MTDEIEFRVLKSGTCPSLSGRSKLTYDIACGPDNDLHVRVLKNSGGGYFSPSYVTWVQMVGVLDKHGNKPITCHSLGPLFKGQSVNTAGFLLAVLKHEGLVQPRADQPRTYERLDPGAFYAQLKTLLGSTKAVKAVKPVSPAAASAKRAANTSTKRSPAK